jgi:ESF2/ABP1 family protein
MRYLPKFKWENLKEKFAYDRKVREERLKVNLSQAKREQNFYLEKAEISKKLKHIQDRQKKREAKAAGKQNDEEEQEEGLQEKEFMDTVEKKRMKNVEKTIRYQQKHKRLYRQKEPKLKQE